MADASGRFSTVDAVIRYVGEHAVVYQDREVISALDEFDLDALVREFDRRTFPVVTGAFGATSDLDGNGRIVVLLTPAVNRLSSGDPSAIVVGFFFGVDLTAGAANSNTGEILYALVPDPDGRFGAPVSVTQVRAALPSTLAHELQHLVHFHQRFGVRKADRQEAVWLSEALAHSAEVMVGEALLAAGESGRARDFLEPTFWRAREFLASPSSWSLLATSGQGSLAERGAGWLFLRYLQGQGDGVELLRRLTWSQASGLDNLQSATGGSWSRLYSDWSAASFTALAGLPPAWLRYLDLDLTPLVPFPGATDPLPASVLAGGFEVNGARLSSSSEYYLAEVPDSGHLAVRLAGQGGGPSDAEARLLLRVVRIR